jgi:LPLT family lysophospholipid transporter-like MFS transporter
MNSLSSRGMIAVLAAQFLSALADNALLFAAIAVLMSGNAPSWHIPMLQEVFVIAFILLAPFVGPFADAWPKGRVMLAANIIKFLGASTLLFGVNPLLAYTIVGVGAAAYSPAKYGILSELVSRDKLVKANGLMEGSTIIAILLGAVLGGKLADNSVNGALIFITCSYLLAAGLNLLIPIMDAPTRRVSLSPRILCQQFWLALTTLLKNKDARFSLIGSSIFWGAGSTLRLLLVAWVPVALSVTDLSLPANMSGTVAIGIALGAAGAASLVSLKNVNRVLPAGILIGLFIILFSQTTELYTAITLLIIIGVAGGFYVVPLNALLQETGHHTVGTGYAVAIQNFFENFAMLSLVGVYILMNKMGIPIVTTAVMFGTLVFILMSLLAIVRFKKV